jgi:chromate transporter
VVAVLAGFKPVLIALIAQGVWSLGRTALKRRGLFLIAAGALAASLLGVSPIVVLGAAAGLALAACAGGLFSVAPLPLLLTFTKLGALVFGGGYVLFAFLHDELVLRQGWLTKAQLLDAIAVGQLTPGPVFTAATFIGYLGRPPRPPGRQSSPTAARARSAAQLCSNVTRTSASSLSGCTRAS